jgi:hypothetical protein
MLIDKITVSFETSVFTSRPHVKLQEYLNLQHRCENLNCRSVIVINPLAYTAGCETGWAIDAFAVISGFVSVDGMTCLIPFES